MDPAKYTLKRKSVIQYDAASASISASRRIFLTRDCKEWTTDYFRAGSGQNRLGGPSMVGDR